MTTFTVRKTDMLLLQNAIIELANEFKEPRYIDFDTRIKIFDCIGKLFNAWRNLKPKTHINNADGFEIENDKLHNLEKSIDNLRNVCSEEFIVGMNRLMSYVEKVCIAWSEIK